MYDIIFIYIISLLHVVYFQEAYDIIFVDAREATVKKKKKNIYISVVGVV